MKMKKIIIVLCLLILTACGSHGSTGSNTSGSTPQACSSNEIVFSEPKVPANNEYVMVKLISFSQETVNWAVRTCQVIKILRKEVVVKFGKQNIMTNSKKKKLALEKT